MLLESPHSLLKLRHPISPLTRDLDSLVVFLFIGLEQSFKFVWDGSYGATWNIEKRVLKQKTDMGFLLCPVLQPVPALSCVQQVKERDVLKSLTIDNDLQMESLVLASIHNGH